MPIISGMINNDCQPLHRLPILFPHTCSVWLAACVTIASALSGCGASPVTLSVASPPPTAVVAADSAAEAVATDDGRDLADVSSNEAVPSESNQETPKATSGGSKADEDKKPVEVDSQQVLGRWRDSFYGQRTLTIDANGKATMLCELDLPARLLYGKQVEFDLEWSLTESKLTFKIKSGRPMESAKSAIKAWGETLVYNIEEANEGQLRVLCSDGTTHYTFRRLSADADNSEGDPK